MTEGDDSLNREEVAADAYELGVLIGEDSRYLNFGCGFGCALVLVGIIAVLWP